MTPVEAARLVAEHGTPLGTSVWRCADRILLDREEFARRYGVAARDCPHTVFPRLLTAHAVLTTHHAQRKDPAS